MVYRTTFIKYNLKIEDTCENQYQINKLRRKLLIEKSLNNTLLHIYVFLNENEGLCWNSIDMKPLNRRDLKVVRVQEVN